MHFGCSNQTMQLNFFRDENWLFGTCLSSQPLPRQSLESSSRLLKEMRGSCNCLKVNIYCRPIISDHPSKWHGVRYTLICCITCILGKWTRLYDLSDHHLYCQKSFRSSSARAFPWRGSLPGLGLVFSCTVRPFIPPDHMFSFVCKFWMSTAKFMRGPREQLESVGSRHRRIQQHLTHVSPKIMTTGLVLQGD